MSRSSRAQRTVVLIGTIGLLMLGTGLAIAAGATGDAGGHAQLQTITSDRPVEAPPVAVLPIAPVTQSGPAEKKTSEKPSAVSTKSKKAAAPVSESRSDGSPNRETVRPKARDDDDDETRDDERETVVPPVRDEEGHESDDDESDDDESSMESKGMQVPASSKALGAETSRGATGEHTAGRGRGPDSVVRRQGTDR